MASCVAFRLIFAFSLSVAFMAEGISGTVLPCVANPLHPELCVDTADYIVIVDAGSMGTRINVFEYTPRSRFVSTFPFVGHAPLSLPELLYSERIVPGISSLATRKSDFVLEADLADHLRGLVWRAARSLQASGDFRWKSIREVPIYLGATAGMRSLNPHDRARVMFAVRAFFGSHDCPFHFVRREQARVLSGEEEGAFGWLALNHQQGQISSDPHTTLGALDMGGGSAQISFIPNEMDMLANMFPMHFGTFEMGPIHLYTHSFLDYGYVHALQQSSATLYADAGGANATIHHPCLAEGFLWNVTEDQFGAGQVGGRVPERTRGPIELRGAMDFAACRALARRMIQKAPCTTKPCSILGVYQPPVGTTTFVAFGEFLQNFQRMGMVGTPAGMPVLQILLERLHGWCAKTLPELAVANNETLGTPKAKLEFGCWLGTFIYELLTYGFGFSDDTRQLHIIDHDAGWAQGQAIYEVNFFPYMVVANSTAEAANNLPEFEAGGAPAVSLGVEAGEADTSRRVPELFRMVATLCVGACLGVAFDRRHSRRGNGRAGLPLLE